ncbi:MAG: hypothetical protein L3K03_00950 [Thermoplasmata archaeon]|nr:hypothetical protein [Thermoplasmata archaeon]
MSAPSPLTDPKESGSSIRPISIGDRSRVPEPPPTMSMSRHLRAGLVFFVIMILFAGVAYPLGIATLGWELHSGPSTTPVASDNTTAPSNNSTGNSSANASVMFDGSRSPSMPAGAGRPGAPSIASAPWPQTYVYLPGLRTSVEFPTPPAPSRGIVAGADAIAR